MKKIFFSILIITTIGVFYLVYNEFSFSPLNEIDLKKLFKGNNMTYSKSCNKDFIKFSFHSELFEIYQYRIKGAFLDKKLPEIDEWEHKKIENNTLVGKWQSCPLNKQTAELYKFMLTRISLEDNECCISFNKEILNSENYYCFIYFNDLEQYFLLYCTNSHELYYIRKKGF